MLTINSGRINLNHFSNGTLASHSIAINTPLVGIIILDNPSPSINASTAVCQDMPNRSDIGVIKGMETRAWIDIVHSFFIFLISNVSNPFCLQLPNCVDVVHHLLYILYRLFEYIQHFQIPCLLNSLITF